MKKFFLLTLLGGLLLSCTNKSVIADYQVIPLPQEVVATGGEAFVLTAHTPIVYESDETMQRNAHLLAEYIAEKTGLILSVTDVPKPNSITLSLGAEVGHAEGYSLVVDADGVNLVGADAAGVFYGVQTLREALPMTRGGEVILPAVRVTDYPSFGYRGMMIDVSRHFFDVDFIKKQIDAMACYKLNHLHLHLTDAAGWRLEIERYPRLMELAAWRADSLWKDWAANGCRYVQQGTESAYGGYYTKEQVREIVEYAQKHNITVVPEIEMPSHSEEVLAAYPQLSCSQQPYVDSDFCVGNEQVFEFLENVLHEVMELFPSPYIHIGGDEASKKAWWNCPRCQARMEDEGLVDVDELQSYFIHRIETFLNNHGRILLGWDEIIEGGLAPNAMVMSWRGMEGGLKAMAMGHRAIMTPGEYCYLDAYQDAPYTQPEAFGGYLPLQKVYDFNPLPETLLEEQKGLLYGVQGNLFSEYIPTEGHMEYMAYPRMLALAEVAWSSPEVKDFESFKLRALKATDKLRNMGYNPFDSRSEVGNRPGADRFVAHLAVGKKVSYVDGSSYYDGYTAGGDSALVDGLRGGWTYGDKRWQGFLGRKGVDVVIDLEEVQGVSSISADFMQICGPGVFMPAQVIVSVSLDGEEYVELKRIDNEVVRNDEVTFETYGWEGSVEARYIRYQAERSNFGGFLFVDEVVVE